VSREPVGVIGAGAWGTALANRIARNRHSSLLWLRDRELAAEIEKQRENRKALPGLKLDRRLKVTTDLVELADSCRLMLVALPAVALRDVMRRLGDHLSGDRIVLHATKGLEHPSGARMSEVIRAETCVRQIGALSGPNLASEVARGLPIATVVASPYRNAIEEVREALAAKDFLVFGTGDLVGVELAGAMASAASVACGLIDSQGASRNLHAMLIAECLREMRRLGRRFDTDRRTFSGLSGVGDLIVSCSPEAGADYELGLQLGEGGRRTAGLSRTLQASEGAATALAVRKLGRRHGVELPMFESLCRVIEGKSRPKSLLDRMLSSRRVREGDPRPGKVR